MLDRRFCAIALVLVAGVAALQIGGVGALGGAAEALAADAKDAKDTRTDIAKQEIALAKQALQVAAQLENQALTDSNNGNGSVWSRRLVEATRKSGATKPEVAQAIKDHLARMEKRVELMKARQQSAQGTVTDVLNARYDVLEAKAWLAEEQEK